MIGVLPEHYVKKILAAFDEDLIFFIEVYFGARHE